MMADYYIAAARWTDKDYNNLSMFTGPMVDGITVETLVRARVLGRCDSADNIIIVWKSGGKLREFARMVLADGGA